MRDTLWQCQVGRIPYTAFNNLPSELTGAIMDGNDAFNRVCWKDVSIYIIPSENDAKLLWIWCEDDAKIISSWCEDAVKMSWRWWEYYVKRRLWCEGGAKMVQRWCGDAAKVMRRSMYNIHCISIEILLRYIISWQNLYLVSKHMVRFLINIWTQILLFSNY